MVVGSRLVRPERMLEKMVPLTTAVQTPSQIIPILIAEMVPASAVLEDCSYFSRRSARGEGW